MSYYKPELKNPSVALGGFGQACSYKIIIPPDRNLHKMFVLLEFMEYRKMTTQI